MLGSLTTAGAHDEDEHLPQQGKVSIGYSATCSLSSSVLTPPCLDRLCFYVCRTVVFPLMSVSQAESNPVGRTTENNLANVALETGHGANQD